MKLDAYMNMQRLTDEDMAQKIGKERSLVSRYRRGEVVPPLEIIAKIERVTDHAVSFRDFLKDEAAA